MGERIRRKDWSQTPLGPLEEWSLSLRNHLNHILHSPFPAAICWGEELTAIYNDAYRPLLGEKPKSLGQPFRDIWPEAVDTINPLINKALEGETSYFKNFEFTVEQRGEPKQVWVDFFFSPLRDEKGEIVGVLSTGTEKTPKAEADKELYESYKQVYQRLDIALDAAGMGIWKLDVAAGEVDEEKVIGATKNIIKRKEIEKELLKLNEILVERVEKQILNVRRQEERFRKLVEASSQVVWTTDAEGYVVEDSPSWRAFTGQSFEEWQGENWLNAVHPEDRDYAAEKWRHAVETETLLETEYRLYHADSDTWHWTKARAIPLRDEEGEVRGWIGMNADIHEQKETEEMQRSYQNRLRSLAVELNKAEEHERERLAAELHNNLGQMLAVGKMRLDTLNKMDLPDAATDKVINITELLDDALAYTRELMSDLKPPPALDKEDFTGLLNWVAQKMEKHGLKVIVEDAEKPERLDEEVRTTLRRCTNELLYNVIRHADTDEARVKISHDTDKVRVTVEDEGNGFNTEQESTSDDEGGFGLFNIRERMNWLGGGFEIDSNLGEGTRATLFAPLNEEPDTDIVDESEDGAGLSPLKPSGQAKIGEQTRVIVVDDHEMMRKGLRKMIEAETDMTVIAEASDGIEAVELAREMAPDVMVMDINLPSMDGIMATQKITSLQPDIRIIGLSLYDREEVARNMQNAGAVAYLTKTEAFESLCATIRSRADVVE